MNRVLTPWITTPQWFLCPDNPDMNQGNYFLMPLFNRKITSDVKTGILWLDSMCSINCRIASSSVAPCATNGQSNPISLQFIDAMD
jgi:hypothetical protein